MENTNQKPDWFIKMFGNKPTLQEVLEKIKAKREAEKAAAQQPKG